VGRCAL